MPKHKARARPPRPPIHSTRCKPSRPAAAPDERRQPTELANPSFGSPKQALASPRRATQVLALAPLALGFAPAAQQRAPTALNGYVPKGLTESQYKAAVAADKSKAQSNKSRFPKGKKTLDIADWLPRLEKTQKLKGDKVVGSGHTFAKQKFSTKSAFDRVFGTNKEMWE